MLTRIDIDSENPFYIPILGASPRDSLRLVSVTGLGPSDITLFVGDYARDGGYYQGRRVGNRNPVITLELNPNPARGETISGLRTLLYKTFMDPQVEGDFLKILLRDDTYPDRYLLGYTEKFEVEPFSQDNLAVISLICPDPFLKDDASRVMVGPSGGWNNTPSFSYEGTAETGFEIELMVNAATSTLFLDLNGRQTMELVYDFPDSDQIVYMNSIRGSRNILMANGSDVTARASMTMTDRWNDIVANDLATPLLGSLTGTSPWLELHSEVNVLNAYGSTPLDGDVTVKMLSFTQKYWGV